MKINVASLLSAVWHTVNLLGLRFARSLDLFFYQPRNVKAENERPLKLCLKMLVLYATTVLDRRGQNVGDEWLAPPFDGSPRVEERLKGLA
jgi:hypothetical protein